MEDRIYFILLMEGLPLYGKQEGRHGRWLLTLKSGSKERHIVMLRFLYYFYSVQVSSPKDVCTCGGSSLPYLTDTIKDLSPRMNPNHIEFTVNINHHTCHLFSKRDKNMHLAVCKKWKKSYKSHQKLLEYSKILMELLSVNDLSYVYVYLFLCLSFFSVSGSFSLPTLCSCCHIFYFQNSLCPAASLLSWELGYTQNTLPIFKGSACIFHNS